MAQATRLIKAVPATRAIPVIAVTAFAMKGDEATMQAPGCDGYLSKPFRHGEIHYSHREGLALACKVERGGTPEESARKPNASTVASQATSPIDAISESYAAPRS
jgi:CheY-like chemotaxis protein